MIIAMIAISALVLALCVYVAIVQINRSRTPPELRGNWWADFERQFHAHAAEAARNRPGRRLRDAAERPPGAA